MKSCCIALNSTLIQTEKQNKLINLINSKLYEMGEDFSLISYFDNNLERITDIFNDKYEIIFVIGTNSSIYNYNIKENLARLLGVKLINFEATFSALKKYCSNNNIVFSVQEEMEVMIPENSVPLCDYDHYLNGFMSKYNNKYIIFLPNDINFLTQNYNKYIEPLIKDISNNSCKQQIIKCYGIGEKELKNHLNEFYGLNDIKLQIISDELDTTIYINYQSNNAKIHNIISSIVSKINKYIYATENISIYQMAVDLLKMRNKTLSISETNTYGTLIKNLSMISPNSVSKAYLFTNFQSIIDTTNIDKEIISTYGEYSVNTVYELDNEILQISDTDISLFILGDIKKDICYIAVGDKDGIHVYKNKINFSSNNIIENICKTATFYLIKKLKQNDLLF